MRNPTLQRLDIPLEDYRKVVQESFAQHRIELLIKQADWIRRTEKWVGDYLTDGRNVNVNQIQPILELVKTQKQHDIWRYCRLWGSIPYNRGCGRLLRYLLRDAGQPGSPVMGIIALSSPILINKPRDQWIGWEYPRDSVIKRHRLLACMDLTVSMAVPPYNHLTAGKMICLAALSNEVSKDYWSKFHAVETPSHMCEGRLALITTTSLYGSSVQYNRLKVGYRPAYQLVGYTSGFGNTHITEEQFLEMERYLQEVGKSTPKGWGTGRSYRLRVYTAYFRNKYGEEAPAHHQSRSVYVAPLAQNTRAFLRGEDEDIVPYDLPFEQLAASWQEKWLSSRLSKPEVMERFRLVTQTNNLLSQELEPFNN